MWKRTLLVLIALFFAFSILLISVFRTASVKYEFNPVVSKYNSSDLGNKDVAIEYFLPYPGRILPDSPFWPLKALRDKLWLFINTNPTREGEIKLLFADKRIGAARILFGYGKFEIGYSTLTKAEKYLEEASVQEELNRKKGIDTENFLVKLANASLRHFEKIEEIIILSPDEAKPGIINLEEYPKKVYEKCRNALLEKGKIPPKNPFRWE